LDRDGRVYITTVIGVQVFDAGGRFLGTIRVPRRPANVAFSGPDKRTLYITAREGLYRLPTLAQGVDRPGKCAWLSFTGIESQGNRRKNGAVLPLPVPCDANDRRCGSSALRKDCCVECECVRA